MPRLSSSTALRGAFLAILSVTACSGGDGTSPPKPAAVQTVSGSGVSATVGTALTTAPTFSVTDASGKALGNVTVTVAVTGGGGTLTGAPTKTSAGATSVGTWTLGTTAGTNTLTVTVSGVAPLTITATGTAGAAAKVVVSSGNSQTALAGTQLPTPLAAAVQDQFGNGVGGQQVTFAATAGGGSITPSTITTNSSGIASGAIWRLGNRGGTQTVSATAGTFSTTFTATTQSSFIVDLRFFGPTMSTEAQTAFTNAANRIKAAIVGQISTVSLQGAEMKACGVAGLDTVVLNESTKGVIIYASVAPIDGPSKILAQAGPCYVRNQSILPAVGVMKFDEADIQNYINTGRFESVVLHEMNHVVGFGTIWTDKSLLTGAVYNDTTLTGSTNPRYTGAAAQAQCLVIGGQATHCGGGTGIAVEQCGTAGTADGHWREMFTTTCTGTNRSPVGGTAAFDTELMTGYAEGTPSMPWSVMSIAQFQDLGYTVNLLAADSYSVPSLLTTARLRAAMEVQGSDAPIEKVLRPRFTVGGGRIQAIRREIQK
jgi:hypothetical protein